jgi:hypothetical protein
VAHSYRGIMKIEIGRMYLNEEFVKRSAFKKTGISARAFFLPWKAIKT